MLIYTRRVIVAGMLTLFTYSCSNNTEHINNQLAQENARLQLQLDRLSTRVDSMANGQNHSENDNSEADLLSESDIDFFRRKGLANPVEVIKTNLIKNSQLIPVKGSLGGTMQFYKERIYILNRQWVMAYFEDGHTAGEMLLEYKVGNTGNISWKVLSSTEM